MGGASWSSRSGLVVGLAAVAGLATACGLNDGSGAGSDTSTGGYPRLPTRRPYRCGICAGQCSGLTISGKTGPVVVGNQRSQVQTRMTLLGE